MAWFYLNSVVVDMKLAKLSTNCFDCTLTAYWGSAKKLEWNQLGHTPNKNFRFSP